ncbi:MAG: hypothetical protein VX223_13175, partial [Myxococcota bacterium]|nr:hypothetical protein [Myxococcota bacterium]
SDLCLICAEPDTFCAMDDRCCDLELSEDICPSTCSAEDIDPRGIPTLMEGPVDALFIERLLRHSQNVVAQGGFLTLRDVLGALKDRLLTDPIIEDPSEVAVIEALVGTTLDTPVDPADLTLDAKIRRVCGVWLATPDFQLWGWTGNNRRTRPVSLVAPGTEFLTLCQNITKAMYGTDGAECAGNEVLIAR